MDQFTPEELSDAAVLFAQLGTPCREHCTSAMRDRDIELIAQFRKQGREDQP